MKTNSKTIKTVGGVVTGFTDEFQDGVALNQPALAYEILDTVLDEGWYPEDACTEWVDIIVVDGHYYAIFGDDALTCSQTELTYIEIDANGTFLTNLYKEIVDEE